MPPKPENKTNNTSASTQPKTDLAREESIAGKRLDRASLLRAVGLLKPVRGIVWASSCLNSSWWRRCCFAPPVSNWYL